MSSAADDGLTRQQRKNRRARARKKEKKKSAAAALKSAPKTEVAEDAVTAAVPANHLPLFSSITMQNSSS